MERIKLDLVPGCVKPILRASQYDNGREWTCDILDNGVPYKFVSGDTCEIHVRKGDNCAVTASVPCTVGQSYVVVTSTEQMCAVSGDNLAELVIMNGTNKIGSCNLILSVEADPLNGSKSSASEIHDLQAQVNEAVDEALSHKGASDIAFDNTGTGLEATNVQSAIEEVNTKTDAKADADDVYDKEYMDGIFEQIDNAFTNVDNTKMNKANPTGTGSFSLNRKAGTTVGQYSHAEGYNCEASGQYSHAEGFDTTSSGQASHAEGSLCKATGNNAHAEGSNTEASGSASHAEGYSTKAIGSLSHAEGRGTIAKGNNQHASGQYNIADDNNTYAEIIGNGTSGNNRSNARTLDWQGNETLAGDVIINGNQSVSGEITRLDDKIDNLPEPMVFKGTLGVGGTIQSLPTASAENEGWMFKCITAGTYAGLTLKVGDTVTCFNPPNTSTYYWDKTGSQDTDTDTWRNIKVNGVEKLGNGISSGAVDFEDTTNVKFEFDANGNKVRAKLDGIYTESDVDELLDDKADADNTYTKAQVDDIVYGILPDDTASGSVANFNTSLALPLKSLAVDVNAVQASGTPTPATPLPISGWSAVSVFCYGTNLWNGAWEQGNISDTTGGDSTSSTYWRTVGYIPVKPITKYYIASATGVSGNTVRARFYDKDKNYLGYAVKSGTAGINREFETNDNVYFMRFSPSDVNVPNHDISLNYPSSATDYEPYITPTTEVINLGGTYYGGHFTQDKDGHRQLVVTHELKHLKDLNVRYSNNSGAWASWLFFTEVSDKKQGQPIKCSHYEPVIIANVGNLDNYKTSAPTWSSYVYWRDDTYTSVDDFIQNAPDITILVELATPIIIDLPDGQPINTLAGVNNFFADTGDTSVVFKSSVNDYVNAHSGGNLLGMGGVYLGGAKSGGSEEETDEDEDTEDTEKTKLDEPKEEVKTIGDTKKLGGE